MKLLAEGRFDDACNLLDEPNSYGVHWTPELIKQTLRDTFGLDSFFYQIHPEGPVFTDPSRLEAQPNAEIIEFYDKSGYAFDCDLALNGEWSDLTAQFEFLKRPSGYAVVLHDLHVM